MSFEKNEILKIHSDWTISCLSMLTSFNILISNIEILELSV